MERTTEEMLKLVPNELGITLEQALKEPIVAYIRKGYSDYHSWLKAAVLSATEVIAIAVYSVFMSRPIFSHWKPMLIVTAINMWLGFDLRGIVAGLPSEAEWLMHRLGMNSFGRIFSAGAFKPGKVYQDTEKCNNCRICFMICPKGVFGAVDGSKIRIQSPRECFACNACVVQCPEAALTLG